MTSIAVRFEDNFKDGAHRENVCYVTLKNKIKNKSVSYGPWGPDGDTMYWFKDGSMLLERRIVREFQLFKG